MPTKPLAFSEIGQLAGESASGWKYRPTHHVALLPPM
ncbi:hypothetical protein QFZ69_004658 [Arthrobacter sp. V1I7]|nr:hypothetical protein [Arthrobacter sp. V1I7]